MRVAARMSLASLVALMAACTSADDGETYEGTAYWTESTGFVVPKEAHEAFASQLDPGAMLWVVGDNLSLPLDFNPDSLETLQKGAAESGAPDAQLPDIRVPAQIAAGTRLTVYAMSAGKLGAELGTIVMTAQPEQRTYGHWAYGSQEQCHHSCSIFHSCPWCSPCGGGCSNITGLDWWREDWAGFNCSGESEGSPCWWGFPSHYCYFTQWQIWCY